MEELNYTQDYIYNQPIAFNLDDLNEKEVNNHRVQALFKRSRHNNISSIKISRDYYELPKRTIRTNGNIYHTFKPNVLKDVQNIFQDNANMDVTIKEFEF